MQCTICFKTYFSVMPHRYRCPVTVWQWYFNVRLHEDTHKIWKSTKLSSCLPYYNALILYILTFFLYTSLLCTSFYLKLTSSSLLVSLLVLIWHTLSIKPTIFKLKTHHKLCNNYVIVYEDWMVSTCLVGGNLFI